MNAYFIEYVLQVFKKCIINKFFKRLFYLQWNSLSKNYDENSVWKYQIKASKVVSVIHSGVDAGQICLCFLGFLILRVFFISSKTYTKLTIKASTDVWEHQLIKCHIHPYRYNTFHIFFSNLVLKNLNYAKMCYHCCYFPLFCGCCIDQVLQFIIPLFQHSCCGQVDSLYCVSCLLSIS